MTGTPTKGERQAGTTCRRLKRSTALPTTIASMNMAMPIGSRISTSMARMVSDTQIEAVP